MVLLFARLIESSIIGRRFYRRRRTVAKSSSSIASTIMAVEEIINKSQILAPSARQTSCNLVFGLLAGGVR